MNTLLIEIGSEEIPARFVTTGLSILREAIVKLLDDSSIEFGAVSEYATPRRLAIMISDVADKQKDTTVKSVGPPKNIAYDDKGVPTKAATGFAKSLNIDVEDLEIEENEKGIYISATIAKKGRPSMDVMSETLPKLISSLQLPKSMRWGDSDLKYFRPIQWILAMLGDKTIPFNLNGIRSSNISYGHRFLSPAAVTVSDPRSYNSILKESMVLADLETRKDAISRGITELESSNGYVVNKDEELLETVTNLVEYPNVVSGSFEEKFINLPKELLVTVMKSHQKYFSVEDREGNILPSFIVVSNTRAENDDIVRRGAEKVLRARLDDAQFYYSEDQKVPLLDHVDKLKKVTFQDKLGSVFKKEERVSEICSLITEKTGIKSRDDLTRAVILSKADLVTGVVGEFPELQGYMGMIYANNSGEKEEVAAAIYEHYLPRFAGDVLPSGQIGTIVSLGDKIDNIASFFSVGLIPTGSEDPYALRRQALGIINILQSNDYQVSIDMLINYAIDVLKVPDSNKKDLAHQIKQFFIQRLEGIFSLQGFSHDLIGATLSSSELFMKGLKQRIDILSSMKKLPEFPALLMAAKRSYNIISKIQPGKVKKNLLKEPAEKKLLNSVMEVRKELEPDNFDSLFKLEEPINTFFDEVLVMDEDPKIKENRLALILTVKETFNLLGDFSEIIEPQ